MNTCPTQSRRPVWALFLMSAVLSSAPALAADQNGISDAQARYQRDLVACNVAPEGTDKAACRREADAVRASQDQVGGEVDPALLARNALKRCEPLSEPFRSDCVARIDGDGTTKGSVAGGGIYRELVTPGTVSPMVPPAAGNAAPPAK